MDQEAVRELARLIADQIAPAEADEFDSQADAWFADPNRAAARDSHGGGPLGFGGLEEVANDAVPIILFISAHVLSAAADMSAAEGIRRVLGRGKRDKTADGPQAPALDVHEVAAAYGDDPEAVRRAVRAAGEEYGADAALIEKIADRVPTLLDL
jgi:hypothetical protein